KINNKKSPRPLTHDLIKNILNVFEADLQKVLIYDMINDVFYSELYIKKGDKTFIVDARTSDAVALAVRSDCPIFIKSEILEVVGVAVEPSEIEENTNATDLNLEELTVDDLNILSLEELNDMLKLALEEEKYELAVSIRDAIKRKSV
ncbi:MAG: bifunctional nuclease family protein, partial [Paludibacter sp.]|nr:bifunctional nuclease family protein [Paludibacter sp.]